MNGGGRMSKFSENIVVFISFFLTIIGFQFLTGIWSSDFGAYGDESLHYVTGLMMRDFIVSGQWLHPMPFAIDYYLHFPKIGLGNWPPLFPFLEGIWMLIAGHSRVSLLIFLALLAALLAMLVYRSLPGSRWLRGLACLIVIFSRATQFQTSTVMAELALVLFGWLALMEFLRLLEDPTPRRALVWAFWTLAAIFTKGNAWILAPVCGLTLLGTGRWRLLMNRNLWLGVGSIALFSVPYTLWTMRVVTQGWDTRSFPGIGYYALSLYKHVLMGVNILGWPLSAIAVVGFGVVCAGPWLRRQQATPYWTALAIYAAVVIGFHTLVPTSIEQRKVFQLFPACIAFLVAGLEWAAARAGVRLVSVLAVTLFVINGFERLPVYRPGIAAIVEQLQARPDSKGAAILVSSNPFMEDSEGGLIAAWAERDRHSGTYMVRATKLLLGPPKATSASTMELPPLYETPATMAKALDDVPIRYVILHTAPAERSYAHHSTLTELLGDPSSGWRLIFNNAPRNGFADAFQVYAAPARPEEPGKPKVNVDMRHRLGIQFGTAN